LLRLSATTLYRLVERRQIPFLKIGGGLRFERWVLASWLDQQRKQALDWQVSPLTAKIEASQKTTGGK
jgi:excisionase family DNA binding protein